MGAGGGGWCDDGAFGRKGSFYEANYSYSPRERSATEEGRQQKAVAAAESAAVRTSRSQRVAAVAVVGPLPLTLPKQIQTNRRAIYAVVVETEQR